MTPVRLASLNILASDIALQILRGQMTGTDAARKITETAISPAECAWIALNAAAGLPDSAEHEIRRAFQSLASE